MDLIIQGFKDKDEIREYLSWFRSLELKNIDWDTKKKKVIASANFPIRKNDMNGWEYQ